MRIRNRRSMQRKIKLKWFGGNSEVNQHLNYAEMSSGSGFTMLSLSQGVQVGMYGEKRELSFERVSGCSTCEEVCLALAETQGIAPAVVDCFGLAFDNSQDGRYTWLAPGELPDLGEKKLCFRMRFVPVKEKCRDMLSQYSACLQYLFYQVKYDYVHGDLKYLKGQEKDKDSRGVGAFVILIMMRISAQNTGTEENVENFFRIISLKDFFPPALTRNFIDKRFLEGSIRNKLKDYQDKHPSDSYPADILMRSFLEHILQSDKDFYEESYSAYQLDLENIQVQESDTSGHTQYTNELKMKRCDIVQNLLTKHAITLPNAIDLETEEEKRRIASQPKVYMAGQVNIAVKIGLLMSGTGLYSMKAFLRMDRTGPPQLTFLHLIDVSIHLAEALQYMEQKNCFHGNLTCENLVVEKFDHRVLEIKVTDPGLVCFYQQLPLDHEVNIKRLPWLDPSMYKPGGLKEVTAKTEVWALGSTLWQMFEGGASPWEAINSMGGPRNIRESTMSIANQYTLPAAVGYPVWTVRLLSSISSIADIRAPQNQYPIFLVSTLQGYYGAVYKATLDRDDNTPLSVAVKGFCLVMDCLDQSLYKFLKSRENLKKRKFTSLPSMLPSYGNDPKMNIDNPSDFVGKLIKGDRLQRPRNCPDHFYQFMHPHVKFAYMMELIKMAAFLIT
ncbi:JAK2-like protein [Mya arenaria]|uniref:JAK2-like protein n=1 Tax=Mya arenaria TaxID=6604 RepID=A0ABY7ENN2_MYAAR|nr:JAK2-like protein [Mya arenaria]